MDNKLTDNETIKALECCTNSFYNGFAKCEECPKFTEMSGCTIKLMCNALDLINRKNAKIERLQKEGKEAVSCFTRMESLYKIKCKELEIAKAEAVKELIESLEDERYILPYAGQDRVVVFEDDINKIAKEMTEGGIK